MDMMCGECGAKMDASKMASHQKQHQGKMHK